MYDLDPKVKVIGKKAGICDGVPSTAALVIFIFRTEETITFLDPNQSYPMIKSCHGPLSRNTKINNLTSIGAQYNDT